MDKNSLGVDYVNTFNALSSLMMGSASRNQLVIVTLIMVGFKRLADLVVANTTAKNAGEARNPFDLIASQSRISQV